MWLRLEGEGPLQRQLYRALRAANLGGRLRAGARLPSTRTLAKELILSRNTVLGAYEQLLAEGYAYTRGGSGTYVAQALAADSGRAGRTAAAPRTGARDGSPPHLSAFGHRLVSGVPRGQASWKPSSAMGTMGTLK